MRSSAASLAIRHSTVELQAQYAMRPSIRYVSSFERRLRFNSATSSSPVDSTFNIHTSSSLQPLQLKMETERPRKAFNAQ